MQPLSPPSNQGHHGNNHYSKKRVKEDGSVVVTHDDSMQLFEELVDKFKFLQTDPAEFSCLKALVLFNPGTEDFLKNIILEMRG